MSTEVALSLVGITLFVAAINGFLLAVILAGFVSGISVFIAYLLFG